MATLRDIVAYNARSALYVFIWKSLELLHVGIPTPPPWISVVVVVVAVYSALLLLVVVIVDEASRPALADLVLTETGHQNRGVHSLLQAPGDISLFNIHLDLLALPCLPACLLLLLLLCCYIHTLL